MRKIFILTICLGFASFGANAQTSFNSDLDKFSYSLGLNIGQNLKNEKLDTINTELLAKAITDVFKGNETPIKQNEALQFINTYLKQQQFSKNIAESETFLAENAKKKGIKITESGIQYEILTKSKGDTPSINDTVKVHYHGSLIDGKVFDSSVDRGEPIEFSLKGVIKGWQEILQLMPVGSKWRVYIPAELAYGENPRPGGPIEPYMALIFEIELLEIVHK